MLKHKLKSMVVDRAPTRYPKSVVTVLQKILEFTYVPDWRKSAAEECFSRALPISKWAFHTNLDWKTVARVLKKLEKDGVIKVNPLEQGSYCVDPEAFRYMKSKFHNTSVKQLERKILKTVRMQFTRNPDKASRWRSAHPAPKDDGTLTCACEKPFCSHPSVI